MTSIEVLLTSLPDLVKHLLTFDATFNENSTINKNSCQLLSINDTHREKLYFTQFILQEFTETNTWLLLTFFICLQNQLS